MEGNLPSKLTNHIDKGLVIYTMYINVVYININWSDIVETTPPKQPTHEEANDSDKISVP